MITVSIDADGGMAVSQGHQGPPPGTPPRGEGNFTANAAVYSPRPHDIHLSAPSGHGGQVLHISDRFYLLLGDSRFEADPEHDYGTLAEQAEAMRKLASVASEVAADLERRAHAQDAELERAAKDVTTITDIPVIADAMAASASLKSEAQA